MVVQAKARLLTLLCDVPRLRKRTRESSSSGKGSASLPVCKGSIEEFIIYTQARSERALLVHPDEEYGI